jgi:putative glutathione S-transferase
LIFRALKGLEDHISVSAVHPDMLDDGWVFDDSYPLATIDHLHGKQFLRDVYLVAQSDVTTRVTVPVLWDTKTNTIVSNESSEIIRMFNSAFNEITGNHDDYWPKDLRDNIEDLNSRIYSDVNNGVYKCGFATSQSAYDAAIQPLFNALEWLEDHLTTNRYLLGQTLTEADWRLFTTLIRFDPVYHLHFKCNRKRIIDYPNLWAYVREMYQWPGVADTVNMDHIVRHYHYSHDTINPNRILPINPVLDYHAPHGRESV